MAKYNPIQSNQFKRDMKACYKRNFDMSLLRKVMYRLENGEILPAEYKVHALHGYNPKLLECHIEPDWLLEYRYDKDDILFIRTGSHSELF